MPDGDLLVRTATGWHRLAIGDNDKVLKIVGGMPTWADYFHTIDCVGNVELAAITVSGTGYIERVVVGDVTLRPISAAGQMYVERLVSGSMILPKITASGTLTITTPTWIIRSSPASPYNLAGTDSDTTSVFVMGTAGGGTITSVQYQVNGGAWNSASGTTNWNYNATVGFGVTNLNTQATGTGGTAATNLVVNRTPYVYIAGASQWGGTTLYVYGHCRGATSARYTCTRNGVAYAANACSFGYYPSFTPPGGFLYTVPFGCLGFMTDGVFKGLGGYNWVFTVYGANAAGENSSVISFYL